MIWQQVKTPSLDTEHGAAELPLNGPGLPHSPTPRYLSRVIAVSSGKGGVGKTNVAVNLGLALARRGLRVALLDADLGTANVDIVLGLRPRYHLHHVVTGQRSMAEIVMEGPFGLRVVPGASGLPELVDLPEAQRQALLRSLLVLDGAVDLLLIDTNAGVGHNVIQFILAARELLLITTPEPTAITDAYALLKMLSNYDTRITARLVVNCVRSPSEGEFTARRLVSAARQFLGAELQVAGQLPFDRSVVQAVQMQSPLMQSHPRCPAALAIDRLAEHLWTEAPYQPPTSAVARFLNQVLSFRPQVAAIS
jgi:flagellar biosynthesis protein FlhG